MKIILTAFLLLILGQAALGQTACTAPGQNPATAFPVCGTATFSQTSVPICGGRTIPTNGCGTVTDVNPFWYKFTCFESGTLGFKIKPHTNSEDYDWQLFDITSANPDNIYTNVSMTIAYNWSGEGGETGASSAGTNVFVCDGMGKPLWSKMPNLVQGHEYLLLVSHFTQTQSGYDLSFGGGTARITDTTQPRLKRAEASCGGNLVRVKLNKKMKCNTVASNGSDFFITPGNIPVTNATAIGCMNNFDTDSIELQLGAFLPPGTYTLNVKNGTDNNTVLDYCNKPINTGDNVNFTVYPLVPTPMDSMATLSCAPSSLRLIFRKPMLCNSVAPDGSDFMISGSYPVSITSATAGCVPGSNISKEIIVRFSQPLYNGGNFTLTLKTGGDGNTILDECGKETPAGSTLAFVIKDTVNAQFSFDKRYGCTADTVDYFHPGGNGIVSWQWEMDDNRSSTVQNPRAIYNQFDTKDVRLVVSNGFCSDTSYAKVALTNGMKASFSVHEDNCPNEAVQFTSTALGIGLSHQWSFGDGASSQAVNPAHLYGGPNVTTTMVVRYTITDSIGCQQTAQKPIRIYSSCYLAVPTAFTPNKDGLNDVLQPLNAIKAEKLDFRVFNRWGQLIYQTNNWKLGWDGSFRGLPQATGVYVWSLSYVDRDTKEARSMKGTAALIR